MSNINNIHSNVNNITSFNFNNMNVRVMDKDNNPWFIVSDVCAILEINNPSQAISYLDDDEKNTLIINEGNRGNPEKAIINESGLYSLILRSRKSEAKRFKKWVTAEVLPSIRKTGGYNTNAVDFNDPSFLRNTLLTYTEKCIQLESENKELKPKADGYDLIAGSDGSMCITDTAKHLQIKPKQLFDYLKMNGWIYRRAGGKGWIAYQDRIQQNVLEHKVSQTFTNGESKIREQVLVTPKGLTKLSKIFSVQPV